MHCTSARAQHSRACRVGSVISRMHLCHDCVLIAVNEDRC
jgi:hypothetical protein